MIQNNARNMNLFDQNQYNIYIDHFFKKKLMALFCLSLSIDNYGFK